MTNFFRKLSREKLYKQWVEKEGLSPDALPADLKKDKRDSSTSDDDFDAGTPYREPRPGMEARINSMSTPIGIRFIFIMVMIIIVLLVALSVVSTILVMRGC